MNQKPLLRQLMQRSDTWRGRTHQGINSISSGHPELDRLLQGGWPTGALSELHMLQQGIGEISLLLPMLREQSKRRMLIWLDPPYIPFAPALSPHIPLRQLLIVRSKDRSEWLWSAEQCIRGGALLIAWSRHGIASYRELRKLQLAASSRNCPTLLFTHTLTENSPALLRLQLQGGQNQLQITRLKLRGAVPGQSLALDRQSHLKEQLPLRKLPVSHYPLAPTGCYPLPEIGSKYDQEENTGHTTDLTPWLQG